MMVSVRCLGLDGTDTLPGAVARGEPPHWPKLRDTTRGGLPFPEEVISTLRPQTPLADIVETKP